MFCGEFGHSVDDKGRVIIPNRFRFSLGERFFMTKGMGRCIVVYTEADYKELSASLDRQPQLDIHTKRLQRFFTAAETSVDGQGRVAIPSQMRSWAKIEEPGEVVIVGTGSRIEIWSKELWDSYNEELTDEMIVESALELGIGRVAT